MMVSAVTTIQRRNTATRATSYAFLAHLLLQIFSWSSLFGCQAFLLVHPTRRCAVGGRGRCADHHHHQHGQQRLYGVALTFALEVLTPMLPPPSINDNVHETMQQEQQQRPSIEWFDPSATDNDDDDRGMTSPTQPTTILPLYPLSATYLPSRVPCTLRNTERRNLQMALDLEEQIAPISDPDADAADPAKLSVVLFCVVLRAIDTGRLARIGTVMRLQSLERHTRSDGTLQRIVVSCVPEDVVEIVRIENAHATSLEHRLRHPNEYLSATVRSRTATETEPDINDDDLTAQITHLSQSLASNYNVVRDYYVQGGVGTWDTLPPFACAKLSESLPSATMHNFTTPTAFWKAAEVWQSLCETVREGQQMLLASDRNTLLVEAAIRKGGPLQLPVHVSDVSPNDRRQVEMLEEERCRRWMEMQLDPCLDFQVLLGLPTHAARLQYFESMVIREGKRLDGLVVFLTGHENSSNNSTAATPSSPPHHNGDGRFETLNHEPPPTRKGAWFDDNW
jgi:hypothetical protein